MVQGATAVIVDILAVPGLVVRRVFHGEAGQVEHLTQQGHVNTQWGNIDLDSTHILTVSEDDICSILSDLGIDLGAISS